MYDLRFQNNYILYLFFSYEISSNSEHAVSSFLCLLFKRFYILIFREKEREGEGGGNINVWLPLACPLLGTWPTTQAYAQTRN